VAYYDHTHRGIYETNILLAVKQAEDETKLSDLYSDRVVTELTDFSDQ
jgi:hypothetical protein